MDEELSLAVLSAVSLPFFFEGISISVSEEEREEEE